MHTSVEMRNRSMSEVCIIVQKVRAKLWKIRNWRKDGRHRIALELRDREQMSDLLKLDVTWTHPGVEISSDQQLLHGARHLRR